MISTVHSSGFQILLLIKENVRNMNPNVSLFTMKRADAKWYLSVEHGDLGEVVKWLTWLFSEHAYIDLWKSVPPSFLPRSVSTFTGRTNDGLKPVICLCPA